MSPWVRLQESALTHPKLVGLVDLRRPFDLWIWGLSYTQTHLTDGHIPKAALPRGTKSAAMTLVSKGLWERSNDASIQIHDYLQWNEDRTTVEKKRSDARTRAKKSRTLSSERAPHVARTLSSSVSVRSSGSSEGVQGKPSVQPGSIEQRAADFLEKYSELYAEHRKGAKILRRQPALDWDRSCGLCRTWDDARLVKLAEIFLTSDDEWITKTDRGFAVFCARATWCDERLAAWEASRKASA